MSNFKEKNVLQKYTVFILLGPTAVGKTAVSISLASLINAEIVSADSRQVYTKLDIGTAKPTLAERKVVKHHLIDVVDPDENFTAANFQTLAIAAIEDILSRNNNVLIVGGTGLYIRALVDFPSYQNQPPIPEIREKILAEIEENGAQVLHDELARFDPEAASKIHPNNLPRLVRAIEVIRLTGRKFSDAIELDSARKENCPFNWKIFGLTMDRKILYERINNRVDEMIRQGWINEVQMLLDSGYSGDEKPLKGLGYKDIIAFIQGRQTLEKSIDNIKRDTRRFAKRQLTFFRAFENVTWIEIPGNANPSDIAYKIVSYINQEKTG